MSSRTLAFMMAAGIFTLAVVAYGGPASTGKSTAAGPERPNLVRNGGFETGDKCPDGWLIRFAEKDLSKLTPINRMDNLTLFWDSPNSTAGKCIKMDTDVNQKEVHRRMFELIRNPDAPSWPKTPTRPPKYDTAAGLEGVTFWTDPIPVEKDKVYRLSVECKGRMQGMFFPKVFVHGYGKAKNAKGEVLERRLYQTFLACRLPAPGRWFPFSQAFCPTDRTPAVTHIRVKLMAYWPPGIYYWDNVSVVKLSEEEAAAYRAEKVRERAKQAKPARPTPKKHKAGESFVIEEEEELTLPEK